MDNLIQDCESLSEEPLTIETLNTGEAVYSNGL